MTTYPFTQEGVASKLRELYALTDPALALQARLIRSDLANWLKTNFALTTPQLTYLTAMDIDVLEYYGAACAICFKFRLNIAVVYPDPTAPLGYGKYIQDKNQVSVTCAPDGTVTASGELTFTMTYRQSA